LSWPPSGPLPPGDALDAGRVDAHRLLRPPPLAASHRGWLTPPLPAAMAARERAGLRAASRHDRSAPPPSLAYTSATAWLSRCRWWARAAARAGVNWYGANSNCDRRDTRLTAAVSPLRVCTASSLGVPPQRHADGC